MKTKFLLSIVLSSLLISSNAYSETKKTDPVKENDKTMHKEHKMTDEHKKMHEQHHNSEQWKNIMSDTLNSVKYLVSMGAKVVKDGNSASDPEKMMMGAKMMTNGLEILAGHQEHHMENKSKNMGSMNMTKENKEMMHKEVHESSMLLIMMANKLIKDGNSNNEGQKMMVGSEMLKMGANLHHSYMYIEHGGMGKHHKMMREEKIIIKK
ncbi:MAG: hypothetical protein U0354_05150 [Candidatus Sericytochromatia bacterium]